MISIVNYGVGNLKAFINIYKKLGVDCAVVSTVQELQAATKIILPGVGAFDHAMSLLLKSGMRGALDDLVLGQNVPVLGVCVGMQLMASSSEEGELEGLNWIPGRVKKFDKVKLNNSGGLPLPHMGWNSLTLDYEFPLFADIDPCARFYFLHSYYYECDNEANVIANTEYGERFSVGVNNGNVYGIQCHPEKSHQAGVTLLKNFARL